MDTQNVKCNLCGSDTYDVVFPEGKAQVHRIVKCKSCDLMYANPQTTYSVEGKMSVEDMQEMDNAQLEAALANFTPDKDQYLKKQYNQQGDYDKVLEFIDSRKKGTLLDVGSYAGVFLNCAKQKGWNTVGIEPFQLARVYSERTYGLKVYPEIFEESNIEPGSVDVLVSFHTIEHIYNPMQFIRKANEALAKGGMLVLETPTYDSFMFRLLGSRERSVRCNGHIYFFTRDSLRKMVESCNFRVVKHDLVGRTLSMDRLFYNIGRITGGVKFFKFLARKLRLDKYLIHVNAKDMQRIYCEKI